MTTESIGAGSSRAKRPKSWPTRPASSSPVPTRLASPSSILGRLHPPARLVGYGIVARSSVADADYHSARPISPSRTLKVVRA